MGPGDLIHGFSPVGSQYGNFCPVHRDFPRNLKKPETRPIFDMAKMRRARRVANQGGVLRSSRDFDINKTTFRVLQIWVLSFLPPGGKCKIKRPIDTSAVRYQVN